MKEIACLRNRAVSRTGQKAELAIRTDVAMYSEWIRGEKEEYDDAWEDAHWEDDLVAKIGEESIQIN